MKNNLLIKLLAVFLTGTMLIGVGCKDYDDDIKDLNNRIDETNASVDELKALIESGSVIKSVTTTEDGLTFTLSNGQSYTVKNGTNGQDATVWTIESDGYWYKDGNKTEYKAIGQDGAKGDDGQPGADGDDGEDGYTYVPNTETGLFDIYQGDKYIKESTISWKASGVSGIVNGNILTLTIPATATTEEQQVEILLGKQLGSVAFVPEVVSETLPYPTTTDEFLHLTSYIVDTKDAFKAYDMNKSNEIDLVYRLNPTDAYVEGAVLNYIDRIVTTRAAGDAKQLLNVVSSTFNQDGSVNVKTSINTTKLVSNKEYNIAALQVNVGQNPVTSDYVYVESNDIDAVIVDTTETKKGMDTPVVYYERTTTLANGETDAYVKNFVGAVGVKPANLEFAYNGEIDLKEYVGLYSIEKQDYLFSLGFTGMSYEFSLPKEYLADDQEKTNQQWFVQLNDGVVKVSEEITGAQTQAIGRTPIVRVDAYLLDNAGTKRMVASSYIKLSIEATTAPDKDDNKVTIADPVQKYYRNLTAAYEAVAKMNYQDINNDIYGEEGLTSTNFWNSYNTEYDVKLTVTDDAQQKTLFERTGEADTEFIEETDGIKIRINLNALNETTSCVEVYTNNKAKTQHSYDEVTVNIDGKEYKGAEYTLTITINSNDKKAHGDFILTQKFYVLEEHMAYPYNILYYFLDKAITGTYPDFDGETQQDIIIVKGQVVENTWKMSSVVSEHFGKVDDLNIFGYYTQDGKDPKNVTDITFNWADKNVEGVTSTPATPVTNQDFTIALDGEMKVPYLVKDMTYTTTLVNGELCPFTYSIVFVNPFVAGDADGVTIYGNQVGKQTAATAPEVLVNDKFNAAILSWDEVAQALALSTKATDTYKVAMPTVTYAFDTKAGDYATLVGNLSEGSTFEVDAASGVVTWENEGATLAHDYSVTVVATVTFEDLSVVECRIPVTISAVINPETK